MGLKALGSLRLEKGYRDFGHDVDNCDSLHDVGLQFTCDYSKDFNGKSFVLEDKATRRTRRLVSMVALGDHWCHHGEIVYRDGLAVGDVRAASYGHSINGAVGLAMVEAPNNATADRAWIESGSWELDVAGRRVAATVSLKPPYDPKGLKIKGQTRSYSTGRRVVEARTKRTEATTTRGRRRSFSSYNRIDSFVEADRGRLKSLSRVGAKLEVRALLVDAALFRRSGGNAERVASPLAFDGVRRSGSEILSKDMLTKQVREELRARGLDGVGKPWVVRARLDDARGAEAAEVASIDVGVVGNAASSLAAAPRASDAAAEDAAADAAAENAAADAAAADGRAYADAAAPAAPSVADKYAAKLRSKTGTAVAASVASAPGDADLLSSARTLAAKDDLRNRDAAEESRWRLGPPGLRSLLAHAAKRSMAVALVARPDTKSRELDDVVAQAGVAFDVISNVRGDDGGALDAALLDLNLEPHRVLAFASDEAFCSVAKKRRLRTVLFVGAGESLPARHDRRPDHDVAACADVVDVIDDLNGPSFRR